MPFDRLPPLALLALLGACGPSDPSPADRSNGTAPSARPNLILVSIDTLRADRLGAYGHDRDTSPNLDALADRGLLFEQCYSTSPWTLTSHLSMLTGLYIDQHGVRDGSGALDEDIAPLAQRLSDAGYDTAGFYFQGWIHPRHGFDRGFDLFVPHRDVVSAQANLAAFLDDRDSERPLFLFLHLFDVHSPGLTQKQRLIYDPPDEFARRYRQDAPDLFEAGDARVMWENLKRPTEDQYDAIRALYDGGIRYTDERMGELFDDWRARGLLDNALLAVTSDHGESLGLRSTQLDGHGNLMQEGLRVPLILTLPDGSRAGERIAPPVASIDLAPTFLRVAGATADDLPGFDLISGERPAEALIRARHADKLALILWPAKSVGPVETFGPLRHKAGWSVQLEQDPAGRDRIGAANRLEDFTRLRSAVNTALLGELSSSERIAFESAQAPEIDEDDAEMLRALGYAEETAAARDE